METGVQIGKCDRCQAKKKCGMDEGDTSGQVESRIELGRKTKELADRVDFGDERREKKKRRHQGQSWVSGLNQ